MDVDCGAELGLVDVNRFDLKPIYAAAEEVEHGDLGCLAVRKRAEQVERPRFGQTPDDLHLAEKPQIASPLGAKLNRNLSPNFHRKPQALDEALRRREPWQPTAVRPRPHSEFRGVDRLALVG